MPLTHTDSEAALRDAHLTLKLQKATSGRHEEMSDFHMAEKEREAAAYMAAIRGSIDCSKSIAHSPVKRVRATSAPATRSPLQPVKQAIQHGVEQFRERAGRLHRVPFVKHPPEELPTIDSYFAHVAGVNGTKRRLCFPQVYARNCVPRVNQSAVDAMRCS